jgi:hypothetical protein
MVMDRPDVGITIRVSTATSPSYPHFQQFTTHIQSQIPCPTRLIIAIPPTLCGRFETKKEEDKPLSAQSALSHVQTCIADCDLASRVELYVKGGKAKKRYTNRNFTVRAPEDERVEAYARSVLQEAKSRASLAENTATSICGTEAVSKSMLGGIAGPETLDECDAAGRKFESRVQECYEAIYGPKNPDEPGWHLWREVDDSTARTKQE